MQKKALLFAVPLILVFLFIWHAQTGRSWSGGVFFVTQNPEQYVVFDVHLNAGQKLIIRLDAKQGAEGKGKLLFTTPQDNY